MVSEPSACFTELSTRREPQCPKRGAGSAPLGAGRGRDRGPDSAQQGGPASPRALQDGGLCLCHALRAPVSPAGKPCLYPGLTRSCPHSAWPAGPSCCPRSPTAFHGHWRNQTQGRWGEKAAPPRGRSPHPGLTRSPLQTPPAAGRGEHRCPRRTVRAVTSEPEPLRVPWLAGSGPEATGATWDSTPAAKEQGEGCRPQKAPTSRQHGEGGGAGKRGWEPLGGIGRAGSGDTGPSVLGDLAVVFRVDVAAQAEGQEHAQELWGTGASGR